VQTQSFPEEKSESLVFFSLYEWHNRLYGVGDKKRGSFDLSDPLKPNLISIENANRSPAPLNRAEQLFLDDRSGELDGGKITLAEIPGLPPRQRLELVLNNGHESFSGNILTRADWDRLTTYQLDELTGSSATFRRLGRYVPTPLELLYGNGVSQSEQAGNLLFEILGKGSLDGSHLAVFRVDGPRPRPIGHFAVPSEPKLEIRCVLPDGRMLLTAGDHRI